MKCDPVLMSGLTHFNEYLISAMNEHRVYRVQVCMSVQLTLKLRARFVRKPHSQLAKYFETAVSSADCRPGRTTMQKLGMTLKKKKKSTLFI